MNRSRSAFSQMKERLLAFYENIRHQVALDAGGRLALYRVRAYADKLRDEMDRRRLGFTPTDGPQQS